jgi:hypothetical protein
MNINDRLNKSYDQIKSIYKSTVNLTSNNFKCDTTDNSVIVEKSKFIIDVNMNEIRLGNSDKPDSMILYGTSTTTGLDPSAPNGSLFFTQNNNGEAYIKNNSKWIQIKNPNNYENLIVNNDLSIDGNLLVSTNLDTSGTINITTLSSDHNTFNSNVTTTGSVLTSNFNILNTSISSNLITTENIYCNNLDITDTLTSNNNINCVKNIITYNNINSNNININSKEVIDLLGNINISGTSIITTNYLALIGNESPGTIGSLTNYSGDDKVFTNGNTITISNDTPFGGSNNVPVMDFDSTQYLSYSCTSTSDILNLFNTGGTVEFMFKTSDNISSKQTIIDISNNYVNLQVVITNNNLYITYYATQLNTPLTINTWYYLAIVYDNINETIYYYLTDTSTATKITITNVLYDSTKLTTINFGPFYGKLCNLRIAGSLKRYIENTISKPINFFTSEITDTMNVNGNINTSSLINGLSIASQSEGFSISGGVDNKTFTVNRTLNFSGTDNTTITFPSTSQTLIGSDDVQNFTNKTINLNAGTVSQAPLQFTSGTNLTTPLSGVIEYDGVNYYVSSNDSNNIIIRKYMPTLSYFRTTADKTISIIGLYIDLFQNGSFSMDANAYYIIEWHIFMERTSSIQYSIITSTSPIYVNIESINVAPYNSNNFNYTTSPEVEVSYGTKFYHVIRAYILNNSTNGVTVKLQGQSSMPITIIKGSHIIIKRIPNTNFGEFN